MKAIGFISTVILSSALAMGGAIAQEQGGGPKMPPSPQAKTATMSKTSISAKGAMDILNAAIAESSKNQWGMTIAIVDDAGRLVAFNRMDGAPMGTIDVAQGKAVTAVKFKMPTSFLQQMMSGGGGMLTIKDIVAVAGGYPIVIDGQVAGAIGVSGGMSGEDDIVAQAGLAALKK